MEFIWGYNGILLLKKISKEQNKTARGRAEGKYMSTRNKIAAGNTIYVRNPPIIVAVAHFRCNHETKKMPKERQNAPLFGRLVIATRPRFREKPGRDFET